MKIIKASDYTLLSTSMKPSSPMGHTCWNSTVYYGRARGYVLDCTTGKFYRSLINNNRGNPVTNTSSWELAEWSGTKTFSKGDYIYDITSYRFYKSLKDNNINHSILDKEWWEYVGTMNKWRMFDQYLNTFTYGADQNTNTNGDISFSIDPEGNSSFYIGNMNATSVRVKEVRKSDNIIIVDKLFELYSDLATWKQYFDATFTENNDKKYLYYHRRSFFDDIKYEITVHNKYGNADVGIFLVGDEFEFGSTLKGETVQLLDYSTVSKEDNGEIFLKKGNYAKSVSIRVHIHPSIANEFSRTINSMVGEPAVFLPGGNKVTDVYGFIQKESIELSGVNYAIVNLSLQGLI